MPKINWGGLVRVLAPRLVGAVVAAATGYISAKTKGAVTLDPAQVTEMLIAYGLAHTASAAYINPVGAASPVVAQEGVEVKQTLTVEQEKKDSAESGAK